MKETAISELESHAEAATEHGALELVDRSIRVPVLFFFGSGVFWLVVASAFYLLSSWQIHTPSAWWAFPGVAWLSFGRAYPAFLNCYIYGWATCAGIGTGIWLLSRLNGVSLRSPLFPVIAGLVWNIGMISGLFSLLAGGTTGRQLLEFPSYSAFILFLALAMISLWAMTIVCNRKRGTASISEWYLVGAFLWFAWMYATANIALEIAPAPGVAQAAINWWYVGALVQLWLTPIALADRVLFDSRYQRTPDLQLQTRAPGFLGPGSVWRLDRNDACDRWSVSRLDRYRQYRGKGAAHDSGIRCRSEFSSDDERPFRHVARSSARSALF